MSTTTPQTLSVPQGAGGSSGPTAPARAPREGSNLGTFGVRPAIHKSMTAKGLISVSIGQVWLGTNVESAI